MPEDVETGRVSLNDGQLKWFAYGVLFGLILAFSYVFVTAFNFAGQTP